jgi:Leucine-rich repeat (LRR) protein
MLLLIPSHLHLSCADLSRNRIRRLSKRAFCNLSNLTTLDISYNKMPAIDLDYTCQLPKLETLNISGNVQLNMVDLKSLFLNMSQLRALGMADFANIPWDMFAMLNNLERLNVSGARLGNETGLLLEPLHMLKVEFQSLFF